MSLNKVILIGNVGKDPEVRYFDSGAAVANFPMATSERGYTLANGTVVPERTEWHNIVVRRDQVSFVEKWVKKGASVYVEGKIRTRTYDDQTGVKRYVTEIHADRVEFYSTGARREDGQNQGTTASGTQSFQNDPFAPPSFQSPGSTATQASPLPDAGEADDLPF